MIHKTKSNGSLAKRADAAFAQAAEKVIQRARLTGTPVIVWEHDRVKEVFPDELADVSKLKTENYPPRGDDRALAGENHS